MSTPHAGLTLHVSHWLETALLCARPVLNRCLSARGPGIRAREQPTLHTAASNATCCLAAAWLGQSWVNSRCLTLLGGRKAVTCLAWTHQGLKLLTGSQDKAVVCQNLQVGPTVQVCTLYCCSLAVQVQLQSLVHAVGNGMQHVTAGDPSVQGTRKQSWSHPFTGRVLPWPSTAQLTCRALSGTDQLTGELKLPLSAVSCRTACMRSVLQNTGSAHTSHPTPLAPSSPSCRAVPTSARSLCAGVEDIHRRARDSPGRQPA